jgi:predicted phosphodiesterase
MRRVAVLSDVHGYLQSLEAVLADAHAAGAQEIVVAGDVVNFGPNPAEVVDLLRQRGARMIRGNHEVELVATYGTPAMPPQLAAGPRHAPSRWSLEALGAERRAFLAALPDRLLLDEATVVVHGSPRYVRDAVTAAKSDQELAEMWGGDPARLAFVGHTHRPLVRELPIMDGSPARRFVNVGSTGFNLDGDTRAAYALAESAPSGAAGDWQVQIRRVPYDIEAAVAAFDGGMRDACRELAELFIRQVRTGRNYFGPWLRGSAGLTDDEVIPSVQRFLAANP